METMLVVIDFLNGIKTIKDSRGNCWFGLYNHFFIILKSKYNKNHLWYPLSSNSKAGTWILSIAALHLFDYWSLPIYKLETDYRLNYKQ